MRVAVGWSATDDSAVTWSTLLAAAEPSSRQRLGRLRQPADRAAVLVAHTLARVVAAQEWAVDAMETAIRRHCHTCGSQHHGRPEMDLDGVRRVGLSVSHTRGLAIVALAEDAVGVDTEPVGEGRAIEWTAFGSDIFGARERQLLAAGQSGTRGAQYWTRKEALAKLAGTGIAVGLGDMDVSGVPVDGGYAEGPAPGWVRDVPVAAGYVAALATWAPNTISVRRFGLDELCHLVAERS